MYSVMHADKARGVHIPCCESEDLAELFGILAGDGYANRYGNSYFMEITGDAVLDRKYFFERVSNLVQQLFGIRPKVIWRKGQRTMVLRIISKTIVRFLFEKGFPAGYKHSIIIPRWIKQNKLLAHAFLRGFFDTDGSFHLRKGKYPIISTGNKSELVIADITEVLLKSGFQLTRYYKEQKYDKRTRKTYFSYRIFLYGKKNLFLWEEMIGFNNERHKQKIASYKTKKYGVAGI